MLNLYRPVDYIGLILNPVIFLALLTFVLVDLPQAGSIVEKNLYIHIIFSLSSYGFLFLAGIQAMILKYQITSIKNIHHSTLMNSFPSIEEMGKIIFEEFISFASGKKTKSEILNLGRHEFAPWQIGITG